MKSSIRLISFFLILSMLFSLFQFPAYAEERVEGAEAVPAVTETRDIPDVSEPVEEEQTTREEMILETAQEGESVREEQKQEECVADVPVMATLEEDQPEHVALREEIVERECGTDGDLKDSGELFAAYSDREMGDMLFSEGTIAPYSVSNIGDRLSGLERQIYDLLKEEIEQIASGALTSTELMVSLSSLGLDGHYTAADLGVETLFDSNDVLSEEAAAAMRYKGAYDAGSVIAALLADCPLELYWYDKSVGCSFTSFPAVSGCRYSDDSRSYVYFSMDYSFRFSVAAEYSAADMPGTYVTDGSKTGAVQNAKLRAQDIVQKYAGVSDLEKLRGYAEEICALTGYNSDAANSETMNYGNPWQLIWVFDGDSSTKVVCEGYSKAFQYLCDLSQFDGDICCYSVTGMLYFDETKTSGGGHMWNLLVMDDGKTYLVDVTNCDSGTFNDRLFLKRCTGSVLDGFTCNGLVYAYDEKTLLLFSEAELTLSDMDYAQSGVDATLIASGTCGEEGDNLTWVLDDTGVMKISGNGRISSSCDYIYYADKITSIIIEPGTTTIGYGVFQKCSNLTSVEIPDSVIAIEDYAFQGCRLTDVYYLGIKDEWRSISIGDENDSLMNAAIHFAEPIDVSRCTVVLSQTCFVYDGSAKKPIVTVKDGSDILTEGKDYDLSYTDNIYAGTAMVRITGIGDYTGVLCTSFIIKIETVNGWIQSDGFWYYYRDGVKQTGWLQIGQYRYYLDSDGKMLIGWQLIDGCWYYLEKAGGVMLTGWLQIGQYRYYLDSDGKMLIGWQLIDGYWYYLEKSGGVMMTGWVYIGRSWYYLNASGVMQTGWLQQGNVRYYLLPNGQMAVGWIQVSDKWYYLYSDGHMAANVWIGNYYVDANGIWTKTK